MSTPYFALYPTDFLADIGHLGNTELGIYWRLLLVYYRDGRPLPLDADKLRRIAMAFSPEECRSLDIVVAEFFILSTEPDGTRVWRHKRADIELARARRAHEKRSAAARETNLKRWGRGSLADQVAERSLSDVAKRPVSDGEPEPEPEEIQHPPTPLAGGSPAAPAHGDRPSASAGTRRGCRLPDEWKPSLELLAWAKTEVPGVDTRTETESFRDYWRAQPGAKGVKLDWDGTWRNWMRRAATRAPLQRSKPSGLFHDPWADIPVI